MSLEQIIEQGTHVDFDARRETATAWNERRKAKPSNVVRCVDGFRLSVIAGHGTYCSPRPGWFNGAEDDFEGPFTAVEVGYPSARPEPWADWEQYCENTNDPTSTVYGYVPVDMVRALVAAHGGEA